MNKTIFLLVTIALFVACDMKEEARYKSSSPEIEVVKNLLKDYIEADWEAMKSYYADTAKVLNNVPKGKEVSIDSAIKEYMRDHELFTSMSYVADEDFFEMVVTDDGETWVNYWGLWRGTLKLTGEKFEIPVHITLRFENQKIVIEHGYWNNTEVVLTLNKLEALKPQT